MARPPVRMFSSSWLHFSNDGSYGSWAVGCRHSASRHNLFAMGYCLHRNCPNDRFGYLCSPCR